VLAVGVMMGTSGIASAQTARDLYTRALARERTVRDAAQSASVQQIRGAIAAYERIVRRYPRSGYSDNALWQAANLALLAYERFGEAADRQTGTRLLTLLRSGYPSSSLEPRVDGVLRQFGATRSAKTRPAPVVPAVNTVATSGSGPRERDEAATEASASPAVTIREITRTPIPDGVRVSIQMDRELLFRHELLERPRRVFFDLKGSTPAASLGGSTLKFDDDVVREIRLGRHPQQTTRVVMDMEGVESYSVFTLYEPYRVVIDFKRTAAATAGVARSISTPTPLVPLASAPVPIDESSTIESKPAASASLPPLTKPPLASREVAAPSLPAPSLPSANSNGQFSLARQLGLGVSRIVLDPGHGGHDPGTRGNGVNESELVLDIALRLRKLLAKQPGFEVLMTRESDVFIPLEQRTAIANREGADLFLSIHANSSRNTKARGVETYFLNFASNPEAEAVAARENSASGQTMHSLPEIVRAIALNNKIDESRDFAEVVQKSMVRQLAPRNRQLLDRGVKQAPFVVLIGAGMPSVLAEISFVTNKQEGQLLKTAAYRQQIAEALLDAVVRYQRSLKAKTTIAAR
jgi:N-acetylmuramoyl-L-alanine amidase